MGRIAKGYRLIFGYLGIFITFIGVITLLPLLVLFAFPSEATCWPCFVIPGAGSVVLGLLLFFTCIFKTEKGQLGKHQDAVLLVLIWLYACAVGALPFYLSGVLFPEAFGQIVTVGGVTYVHDAYTYTESFFEAVSGYGTAGLSIFRDFLDQDINETMHGAGIWSAFCPHPFLLYRSIIQFFGGVGLVLIVASVLSDRYGMRLYAAEGHNDKLLPNLSKSAKLILGIYTGYIVLGSVLLWLFGLDWFDSVNNSIAALATGGFSTVSSSITYFITQPGYTNGLFPLNQIGVEVVMCVLMLLGATSFVLHLSLLTGRFKKFFKDCEIRMFAIMAVTFIPTMALAIMKQGTEAAAGMNYWDCLHLSAFQFISCITTSGFSSVANIANLGTACMILSVIALTVGGGMGSTAGAFKQYRVVVVFRSIYWNLKHKVSSSRWTYPAPITRNGDVHQVTPEEYRESTIYLWIYLATLLVGAILCSFFVETFDQGLYEFASALSGTGNSVIDFAGSYRFAHPTWEYNVLLWILSIGMFLGRLEITPFFFALARSTSDVFHKETN